MKRLFRWWYRSRWGVPILIVFVGIPYVLFWVFLT